MKRMLPLIVTALLVPMAAQAQEEPPHKPVLLYSTHYHAEGQDDYRPDGPYAETLDVLGQDFEVRVSDEPITRRSVRGLDVIMIVNPSAEAVGGGPAPPHIDREAIFAITNHVAGGGGLFFLSNQSSAHNCEKLRSNRLLEQFGIRATHFEVGVKRFDIPADAPVVGGLRWAYYYGSILEVDGDHFARPRAIVGNSPANKPLAGMNGPAGAVLAVAEVGKGRVVVGSDTGWATDWAINEIEEPGSTRIHGQDNGQILRRLGRWVAGLSPEPAAE